MAKGKSGPKVGLKGVLLAKGEYLALGVSAVALAVLLVWGAGAWSDAKDPKKISDELEQKAKNVYARIRDANPSEEEAKAVPDLPPWVTKPYTFATAPPSAFPLTGPQFDPIAKPDTKRDKPVVLPIGKYQADLVRGTMLGYDIVFDQQGQPSKIGVITSRQSGPQNPKAREDLIKRVKDNIAGGKAGKGPAAPPPKTEGGFDASAMRVERTVEYVSIDDLGKALTEGRKDPAAAVVPLRMVVLSAEVPYKRQVEEIRRALRLPTYQDAQRWGPVYDGFEVQRRVTRVLPGGKAEVVQDWPADNKPNYDFEAAYADQIARRKFEDSPEEGYLASFIRYDMALALPLPKLSLGAYPPVKLDGILATIAALKKAATPPEPPNALRDRLTARPPREDLYRPKDRNDTGAAGFQPGEGGKGPGLAPVGPPPKAGVPPKLGEKDNLAAAPPVEIEHLLLRLVDVDVRPGFTYEYRVRLRMLNPNEGMDREVANPAYAKEKVLYSPWAEIADTITLPGEKFQYAVDPAVYRGRVEKEFPAKEDKDLKDRLQVRDNQVVVEQVEWREQVRTDAGGRREPVGAWVVSDVPVGRGEWVGRKQYVKLPVWSSEAYKYVLREVPDRLQIGKKEYSPRGWLLDLSADKSVVVDFEGGRVSTPRPGGTRIVEDAAVEVLIVGPDGSLVVRSSEQDEKDERNKGFRPREVGLWEKWVAGVEKARSGETDKKEFDRKDGPKSP